MSTTDPQFEPTSSEEIVAYLDGELSPDEAGRVEARLAADPAYRAQLQQLDQAWSALEELPPATVDDNFAKTTIEMVAFAAEKDLAEQTRAMPIQRRRKTKILAIVGFCAAVAGFAVAATILPNANRRLIDNLPVILEVDVFTQIDDVDFLRAVERLFVAEHNVLGQDDSEGELADYRSLTAASAQERRAWIEGLPAYEKEFLAEKTRRFDALPPPQRERIRVLQEEIVQASDGPALQATLVAYGNWFDHRTPGEQAELGDRSIPVQARLDRIRRLVRSEFRSLSPPETEAFRRELISLARERFEREREKRSDRPDSRDDRDRSRWDLLRSLSQGRGLRDQETVARLVEPLDEETKHYFAALPPRRKQDQLRNWVSQSLRRPRNRDVSPQDLERIFENDLTNDEREQLLGMSRDQMREQLEQRARRDGRDRSNFDDWFDSDRRRRGDGPPRDGDRRGPRDEDRFRDRPPPNDRRPPPGPDEVPI